MTTLHSTHRPAVFTGRIEYEYGDKIIMPESAFAYIKALRLPFPLTFEVFNDKKRSSGITDRHGSTKTNVRQFCGVLEFTAPEGQAYLPSWMMSNLQIIEGGRVFVKTVLKVRC
jgi:ubiquitin fusion degradation protein 1